MGDRVTVVVLTPDETELLKAVAFSKSATWWDVVPDTDRRNEALHHLQDLELIEIKPGKGIRAIPKGMALAKTLRETQ